MSDSADENSDDKKSAQSGPSTQSEGASSGPSRVLLQDLSRISTGFADVARDGVTLLKAETRLAASALLLIMVLTMMIAFLLAAATLLLVAAPVVLLIELGWLGPTLALVAVILLALLVSAVLFWLIIRLAGDLLFQRSRAALARWPTQAASGKTQSQHTQPEQNQAEQNQPEETPPTSTKQHTEAELQ